MRKGFTLWFPGAAALKFKQQSHHVEEALNDMRVHKNPTMWRPNFAKEPYCRLAPGQERRKKRREKSRQKDREKVKEIISMILSKECIMSPPVRYKDLNVPKK